MSWDVVLALASSQLNLITRSQFLANGGSDSWLLGAVQTGRLTWKRRGVYALAGYAPPNQALMAACLAAGPSAAASHMAAAAAWGAEQVPAGAIEITTFDNRAHRMPGVTTHRSCLDPAKAITAHDDLPIVVAPLVVVQLAATRHPYLVKGVANDLVKRHLTTFPAILEWIDIVGDRRSQELRALCVKAAAVGGHDDSPPARTLCEMLIAAGVTDFETDHQVVTPDGIVVVDIAWPPDLFGLEYNGARDHEHPMAIADDSERRLRLAAEGWQIVDANRGLSFDEVVRLVQAALAQRRRIRV